MNTFNLLTRGAAFITITLVASACMPPERTLVAQETSDASSADALPDNNTQDSAAQDSGTDIDAADSSIEDSPAADSAIADAGNDADAPEACTTFPQSGCAASMNCVVLDATGKTGCILPGTTGLHAICSNLGDCSLGLTCVDGICKAFCASTSNCSATKGSDCRAVQASTADGGTKPIPGYSVCNQVCDPTQTDGGCSAGAGCTWFGPSDAVYADCAKAGIGTGADGCSVTNPHGCAPGFGCSSTLPFALTGCEKGYACPPKDYCARYCFSPGANDCASGTECKPFGAFGTGEGMCVAP
jgi:hypothetical protein